MQNIYKNQSVTLENSLRPLVLMAMITNFLAYCVIVIFAFSLLSIFTANANANEAKTANPYVTKFWVSGMSSSRVKFETELAELILRKTVISHGPYEFSRVQYDVNYHRGRREAAIGERINMLSNPLPNESFPEDKQLDIIPIPIMKGLMGYRLLVAKKSNIARFSKVQNFKTLNELRAGQVNPWVETKIYRDNNIRLITGPTFESLITMLSHDRFDYLPLGISEVDDILHDLSEKAEDFTIVPNLAIYYAMPIYFQVSKKNPQLANRIKYGLKQVNSDGSFDDLFRQHFSDSLDKLEASKLLLFQLKNTQLPLSIQLSPPILVKSKKIIRSELFATDSALLKSHPIVSDTANEH